MNPFGSTKKTLEKKLIDFQNFEFQIIANDRVDDLSPALKSMEATQIVVEMLIELADYVKKHGKSEKANKSQVRLVNLFDAVVSLNNLTGDLNTLKLNNKAMYVQWLTLKNENSKLKQQLENIEKAENF